MSLAEGIASVLHDMTLGELALVVIALLAYSLAINGSFSAALRSGAASLAFAASVGFATLSSGWMSAVVFLALTVVGVAVFAGMAWALSSLLGLADRAAPMPSTEQRYEAAPASQAAPEPVHSFGRQTSAMPL